MHAYMYVYSSSSNDARISIEGDIWIVDLGDPLPLPPPPSFFICVSTFKANSSTSLSHISKGR